MKTKFNPNKHHRRSIRLPGYDYTGPGGYFITICTYERLPLFGKIVDEEMILSLLGRIAVQEWKRLVKRFPFLELGEFVVMPNHLHGILIINGGGTAVAGRGTAVEEFNAGIGQARRARTGDEEFDKDPSRHAPTREGFGCPVPGSIPTIVRSYKASVSWRVNRLREHPDHPVWQRNYYEHVIRDKADWERITTYIQNNPLLWDKDQINPDRMK
jgi:putative transposase